MKYGRSLQELAIELDRQAKVKKDYVATAGAMRGLCSMQSPRR